MLPDPPASATTPESLRSLPATPDPAARASAAPTRRWLPPVIVASLLACYLIWGSTYWAIRVALDTMPPFWMMGTRFLAAGALLMAWALARGQRLPAVVEWRNAALIGTLMLGGGMGGVAYAEQSVGSGLVAAFIAVVPVMVALLGLAWRQRPSRWESAGIAVGALGAFLLTQGESFRASLAGVVALLIGTGAWALGSVLSQRRFRLAPGAAGFASEMLCGGTVLMALSLLVREPSPGPLSAPSLLAWGYLVVFGSLIAFSAYMVLLGRASPALATSYAFVNPVVAMLIGITFGSEHITAFEWWAAGIVLIGVCLILQGTRRRR